jgi:hypothetical protein
MSIERAEPANAGATTRQRPVHWPDDVDLILDSDLTLALASVTPLRGCVLLPVTNFAVRDRAAGTLTAVNSSVGVSRKLERIRENPRVALAYHTRQHGFCDRPEYVLVQGRASLSEPQPRYLESIRENWERFGAGEPPYRWPWRWWLRPWQLRVGITIAVERIIVWPDLRCCGEATIYGAALSAEPDPQRPPAKGTGPRISSRRAARRASRQSDVLLSWTGADGYPTIVPVDIAGADSGGMILEVPAGLVPNGGRRAGLAAHTFGPSNIGIRHRRHTGWLEAEAGARRALYAPHTQAGFHIPRSRLAYKLMAGIGTRWGMRAARKRGFVPEDPTQPGRRRSL